MTHFREIARSEAAAAVAGIGKARHGIVTETDPGSHSVKVQIQPKGNETGWIQDPGLSCGDLRISSPCEQGSHVVVESVEGEPENYVIVARFFDNVVRPPISPKTGKPAQQGEMLIMTGQGKAPPAGSQKPGKPTTPAAWVHILKSGFYVGIDTATVSVEDQKITMAVGSDTSMVIADGSITFHLGGTSYTMTSGSLAASGGTVTSDKDVLAAGISGKGHDHTGVRSGTDTSGGPT